MNIKWIGALLIVASCGAVGIKMSMAYIKQERQLDQLLTSMHYIKCELQYRLTPLSQVVYRCTEQTTGAIRGFYQNLQKELDMQDSPNAQYCMRSALAKSVDLFPSTVSVLRRLGETLGAFDLDGQLIGIEEASNFCRENIDTFKKNRRDRIRNYQTLGLCAGAALVILFM